MPAPNLPFLSGRLPNFQVFGMDEAENHRKRRQGSGFFTFF
jgi:hypothetical protein